VKILLDTHLLRWAAGQPEKLSTAALELIENPENQLLFSAASLWEIAIKAGLGRSDFVVEPGLMRRGLLDNGYEELSVSGAHAVALRGLPAIHKDPFDRILVAQAQVEGIVLVTSDDTVSQYPGAIKHV
jgi:PIN domain nuclease of toxin-antitoxin system